MLLAEWAELTEPWHVLQLTQAPRDTVTHMHLLPEWTLSVPLSQSQREDKRGDTGESWGLRLESPIMLPLLSLSVIKQYIAVIAKSYE
jgi:hypothetical protein